MADQMVAEEAGTRHKGAWRKGAGHRRPGHTDSGQGGSGKRVEERKAMEQVTEQVPTVVVDDLHITYRVYGTSVGKGSAPSALKRMIRRRKSPALREVEAIRGVSFTAHEGESIGLIGRNGSGKSTLLRAIAGLLPPTSGAVYTVGQPSLLGVTAALMNQLSGERNVVLGCLAMGMKPTEVRERYDDIVEFSGLGDFIDLPMRTYSSGMSQRLRFAIAAAKSHDVLLIDEALATGDADFRRRSEERIRELRDDAGTVFLVSHSLDVVTSTCNRAIWLDNGQIKMDGDAESVVKAYTEAVAGPAKAGKAGRKRVGKKVQGKGLDKNPQDDTTDESDAARDDGTAGESSTTHGTAGEGGDNGREETASREPSGGGDAPERDTPHRSSGAQDGGGQRRRPEEAGPSGPGEQAENVRTKGA